MGLTTIIRSVGRWLSRLAAAIDHFPFVTSDDDCWDDICKCGHNRRAHGPQNYIPDEYDAHMECMVDACVCEQFTDSSTVGSSGIDKQDTCLFNKKEE